MTPEDLKIMQARLEAKGVSQDPGYELGRKLLALYDGKTLTGLAGGIINSGAKQPECRAPGTPGGSASTHGRSSLEDRFSELWQACGGPPLCREHRIFGERKWRADFAHIPSATIIEVDGGTWVPGGHNMAGHIRDCERDLECVLAGWRVVRLVPSMITIENIERLIAFVKGAI